MLPQFFFSLLKLMLNISCMIDIHGRVLFLCDFMKHIVSQCLCLNAYEPVSVALDVVIDSVHFNTSFNDLSFL